MSDARNTSFYSSTEISVERPYIKLSAINQIFLGFGVLLVCIIGQFFAPIELIAAGIIGITLGYVILRNDLLMLISYISIILLVKLRMRQEGVSPIDIMAGLLMTGIFLTFIIKRKLFLRKQTLAPNNAYYFVVLFAIWTSVISFIYIAADKITFNFWYRELLIFSPLLFIPILFVNAVEKNEHSLKILAGFLLIIWFFVQVASVILVRNSMQNALFLYETGRANFDISNSAFMIIVFLSLSTIEAEKERKKYYVVGILISVVGLLLTFNRTNWLITIGLLPILFFMAPKAEHKNRNKVILSLLLLTVVTVLSLLFLAPSNIQLLIKWFFAHFLTSSGVKTDPSLVNRYIEWRNVWQQILSTPISGVGFGGYFKNYAWIGGITVEAYYTHSGVLGILLKSGIVGFILIFTAYIKFFLLGCKLAYSKLLSDRERALTRAGILIIIFIVFQMLTLNPFMHREILWYLGLVWAYFIYLERKVKRGILEVPV
jgi:O-antigen ligase